MPHIQTVLRRPSGNVVPHGVCTCECAEHGRELLDRLERLERIVLRVERDDVMRKRERERRAEGG